MYGRLCLKLEDGTTELSRVVPNVESKTLTKTTDFMIQNNIGGTCPAWLSFMSPSNNP